LGNAQEMVIKGEFICSHLAFAIHTVVPLWDTVVPLWDMHSEEMRKEEY
jgi:hypothetical protein